MFHKKLADSGTYCKCESDSRSKGSVPSTKTKKIMFLIWEHLTNLFYCVFLRLIYWALVYYCVGYSSNKNISENL